MEALGINLGMLIIQIFAFIIVMLTLNAWVYKPMLNMMETRKQKIAQGLEDARVAAEARADAQKEADKIRAEAQAEAAKIVREATERATVAGQDVKAAAEAEAAKAHEAAMRTHNKVGAISPMLRENIKAIKLLSRTTGE